MITPSGRCGSGRTITKLSPRRCSTRRSEPFDALVSQFNSWSALPARTSIARQPEPRQFPAVGFRWPSPAASPPAVSPSSSARTESDGAPAREGLALGRDPLTRQDSVAISSSGTEARGTGARGTRGLRHSLM